MISEETISDVLDRGSILDFAGELGTQRRQGKNVAALCPFHNEKTPSFHIRDDGKFYYCFGCLAAGNVVSFLMKTRGVSFPDAIKQLAERYGIEVKEEGKQRNPGRGKERDMLRSINKLVQGFFVAHRGRAPESAKAYLASRGLNEETLQTFGVGYAPSEWRALSDYLLKKGVPEAALLKSGVSRKNSKGDLYDLLRGRVTFPIVTADRHTVGFGARSIPGDSHSDSDKSPKYINSSESVIYRKSDVLFGLPLAQQAARKSGEIFILEGYFDVASFHQYGVAETVATCGTALTTGHVTVLSRSASRVRIIFDADVAGRDAAAKSYEHFINSGLDVTAIFLEEGHDPDSFAQQCKDTLRASLDTLTSKPLFDCYADYLLRKRGYALGAKELPASIKGGVAEELAKVLGRVENPIERDELVKRGAFLLRVDAKQLGKLLEKDGGQKWSLTKTDLKEESKEEEARICTSPQELPPHEIWLLRCIMVLRDEALQQIESKPELIAMLSPSMSYFIESFQGVLREYPEDLDMQRVAVKRLLENLGTDWRDLWRESYEMAKDPDVSFEKMLMQCLSRCKAVQVRRMMAELARELEGTSPGEPRYAELLQSRLELERRLRIEASGDNVPQDKKAENVPF